MTSIAATGAAVERVTARAFTVPTDAPERDGTAAWDSTTLVLAEVEAEGVVGIGYAYGEAVAAELIRSKLADVVSGLDATAVPAAWWAMRREVRNAGLPGVCATAISAVDIALWDLKGRLLGRSLAQLLKKWSYQRRLIEDRNNDRQLRSNVFLGIARQVAVTRSHLC